MDKNVLMDIQWEKIAPFSEFCAICMLYHIAKCVVLNFSEKSLIMWHTFQIPRIKTERLQKSFMNFNASKV